MAATVTLLILRNLPRRGQALRALIRLLSQRWQGASDAPLHVSCDTASDWAQRVLTQMASGSSGRLRLLWVTGKTPLSALVGPGDGPQTLERIRNTPDGALVITRRPVPRPIPPGLPLRACPALWARPVANRSPDSETCDMWLDGVFTVRSHNSVTRLPCGQVLKRSRKADLTQERSWYEHLSPDQARLALYRGRRGDGLLLEHVPWMTFAEALLSDPGITHRLPEVTRRMIAQMRALFWSRGDIATPPAAQRASARIMLVTKTRKRLETLLTDPELSRMAARPQWVNGCRLPPFRALADALLTRLEPVADRPLWGHIHGDFHFSNIMVSLGGSHLRLIDPRGAFGQAADPREGDVRYDLAKLRHSYHFQYDCFAHGLFRLTPRGPDRWELDFLPWVDPAMVADLDHLLQAEGGPIRDIFLIEMALIASALPIHATDGTRARAMMLRCSEMLAAFIDTETEMEIPLADHHDHWGHWPSRGCLDTALP
ncbi:hypothetical protein ACG74X_19600 [Marivita sp. S0852]|uniref:hypothetical protein n=1 Tax=Marivita sp. S0852 TaxID=3373893 RepID=UPI0039828976